MKVDVKKFTVICVAAGLLVPGAAAANSSAGVQLELKAAADTASAQHLAQVAPRKADVVLKRSRHELQGAFEQAKKRVAAGQERAREFSHRLRTDAQAMRDLAKTAAGRLRQHAKQAIANDIQMQSDLADAARQQSDQAGASSDGSTTTDGSAGGNGVQASGQVSITGSWAPLS